MAVQEGYISPQGSNFEGGWPGPGCPYHEGVTNHELQDCNEFSSENVIAQNLEVLTKVKSREGSKHC